MNVRAYISIVAIAFMLIFVFQNMEMVSVDFLIWSVEASRILIYLSLFLIGVLVGWLGSSLKKK